MKYLTLLSILLFGSLTQTNFVQANANEINSNDTFRELYIESLRDNHQEHLNYLQEQLDQMIGHNRRLYHHIEHLEGLLKQKDEQIHQEYERVKAHYEEYYREFLED